MKTYYFIILLIITLFTLPSCNSKKKCDKNLSFDTGKLTNNWVYVNKQFGFSLKLPSEWYFPDNRGIPTCSVPMSTPLDKKMANKLFKQKKITLKDIELIKAEKKEAVYPIMSICDSPIEALVNQNNEGNSLVFYIQSSIKQDQNQDLEYEMDKIKNMMNQFDENFKKNNKKNLKLIHEMPFGKNEKIPCFNLIYRTFNGKLRNKQFGLKNFGCVNILITIDYLEKSDLNKTLNILRQIKN